MTDLSSPAPKAPLLRFEPSRFASSNYSLEPAHQAAQIALGLTLCMGSFQTVADAAYHRVGYGNTDYGFGLDDYPTRPDRAGMVRWWRWNWVEKKDVQGRGTGKHRTKTRKFHLPEATYMGVLAAVLRENGWLQDAEKVEAMIAAQQLPVEKFSVRFAPPLARGNYQFTDYSREYDHCLSFILELGLERARELALKREGHGLGGLDSSKETSGKFLEYGDENLTLHWNSNTQQVVSESAYLDVLEQLLTLHRLPSIRGDHSPYPTVLFRPRVHDTPNYRLAPRTKATVTILETLLAFPWLEDVAKQVLRPWPSPPGFRTHQGHGFLFGEDTVTITHRHGPRLEGGWVLEVSKMEFLAVLAALLKAREFKEYAQQVEAMMPSAPVEPIDIQWRPDPYQSKNYRITPFDARAADCLETILCRNNLELPRDEARREVGFRWGYYMVYGLDWRKDGQMCLLFPDGNDRMVPAGLYLNVLEQVLALNGLEGVLP